MLDLPLTVNTRHIATTWLPAALNDGAASFLMDKEVAKAFDAEWKCVGSARRRASAERRFSLLNVARCTMRREYYETVERLRDRGGLLLLVWGA